MTDPSESQRFKPEMPRIPGLADAPGMRGRKPSLGTLSILVVVLFVVGIGAHYALRPRTIESTPPPEPPRLQVPPPAPDPDSLLPVATAADPVVASVEDLKKPWSAKEFLFRDRMTGENIPSLLVRLPGGSATQASGYWGLALTSAYNSCRLEYITDIDKLRSEYEFRNAKHPMVGDPCSRTVFDPAKMVMLRGNIWVRGAIVQGSDVRPPLGIEIQIQGKNILAVRRE
ncbi:MAG TPA: hypothetical protein VKF79_11100 [Candidatus Acidoferrum sp.]|nr:hypothetical protein [Candidatus Acidoferrum sp.]